MILTPEQFIETSKHHKYKVFTNGCFDIIHPGHIVLFRFVRLCSPAFIAVNSDDSIRRLKGNDRPINCLGDRLKVLDFFNIGYITWFDEDTPIDLINQVNPIMIIKGGDYNKEEVVGYNVVSRNGGKVVIISTEEGYSTTAIINKIRRNDEQNKN